MHGGTEGRKQSGKANRRLGRLEDRFGSGRRGSSARGSGLLLTIHPVKKSDRFCLTSYSLKRFLLTQPFPAKPRIAFREKI